MDKINVSRIQDSFKCEVYAHNRWRLGAQPVFEGVPMRIGSAWHAAMESLMKGGSLDMAHQAAANVLSTVDESMLPEKKLDEFIEQSELVRFLIPHVSFPPEWEILQVETELQMNLEALDGTIITLRGRPDAVIRWNGKLWHVQHKTTNKSVSWPFYEQAIARSFHEAAYTAMLEASKLYSEPVAGTVLLGMRKLSLASAKKDPQSCFHRAFIPVMDRARALQTIVRRGSYILKEDVVFEADMPLQLLQNRDSCLGSFKNMPCAFLEVCNGQRKLEDPAYFKHVDPYAVYAEGEETP